MKCANAIILMIMHHLKCWAEQRGVPPHRPQYLLQLGQSSKTVGVQGMPAEGIECGNWLISHPLPLAQKQAIVCLCTKDSEFQLTIHSK